MKKTTAPIPNLDDLLAVVVHGATLNYAACGFLAPTVMTVRNGEISIVGVARSPGAAISDVGELGAAARELAAGADLVVAVVAGVGVDGNRYVVVVGETRNGTQRVRLARPSGRTLVWQDGDGPPVVGLCSLIGGAA